MQREARALVMKFFVAFVSFLLAKIDAYLLRAKPQPQAAHGQLARERGRQLGRACRARHGS